MSNFLTNILGSDAFYYFLVIWLLICLAAAKRRNALYQNIKTLVAKPIVFEEDTEPTTVDFYPRRLFEIVAVSFRNALERPFKGIIYGLSDWINRLRNLISNKDKRWLPLGRTLFLLLFMFFIFADAIAISTSLAFFGLINPATLWEPLNNYAIAAAGGSLFAILVASIVTNEIYSKKSEFSDWDEKGGVWLDIARALARFLIVFGFIVVIFLGMQRLISLGYFPEISGTLKAGIDFVVTMLVPLNTVVATALIAEDGIKGFILPVIVLLVVILGLFYILDYLVLIIGHVFPFVFDIAYRLLLMILNVAVYLILTPIDLVISLISSPFRRSGLDGESSATSDSLPKVKEESSTKNTDKKNGRARKR